MIATNSITAALYTILSSDATLVSSGVNVDLYSVMNSNINRLPWIGIVPGDMGIDQTFEPRRANITEPWMASLTIPLVIQVGDRNKLNAMQKLDQLQTAVMTAINEHSSSRRTINNTVDIITGFSASAFDAEELEDLFAMRQINITAELLT